ncbi:hypothetical protein KY284_001472 [Solanum tuberosum]|nr:hypothetical protein KY284_001472 [Solanum tuberosum]
MENLLLMSKHELFMKDMKKYYVRKLSLNMILINVTHIIKLQVEKRREEYMVLELKQKVTMDQIFVSLSQSDASSSIPSSISQSAPMENMDEFVKKLIPTLTDHMIPILLERIQGVTSLPSHQSADTPIGDASSATPMVPNKVVSDDDHISSP